MFSIDLGVTEELPFLEGLENLLRKYFGNFCLLIHDVISSGMFSFPLILLIN